MGVLKLGVLALLPCLLLAGSPGLSDAAGLQQAKKQGIFGTVTAVSGDHPRAVAGETDIALSTVEGPVRLTATQGTIVRIPGRETATIDHLNRGDAVAVLASDGRALRILVRTDRPVRTRHFTGVLISGSTSRGTVSLLSPQGEQVSAVAVGEAVDLLPGELVTAVLQQDVPTGSLLATGLDRAESSLDRIQATLEQAAGARDGTNLQALRHRLEENSTRHLTTLDEAAQRAEPSLASRLRLEADRVKGEYAASLSRFGARPPSAQVTGVITSLDEERGDEKRGKISVAPHRLKAVEVAIAAGTAIDFQGRQISFEQLDLASRVSVRYDLNTKSAIRIVVLGGETLPGGVEEVLRAMAAEGAAYATVVDVGPQRPEGSAVAVQDAESGEVLNFLATKDSVILAGGQASELGKLRPGAKVAFGFDPETSIIEELDVLDLAPSEVPVSGVVHAFAAKAFPSNLSILTPDGKLRTLSRTADTVIRRDGRRVSIAEVRLGDLVRPNTRYLEKEGDKELVLLSLKSPGTAPVHGVIRAITPLPEGKIGLTLTNSWLELVSLRVTGATQLVAQGRSIGRDDLAPGQRVQAGAYDPISTEAVKLVLEPARSLHVSGEITAIDVATPSITVSPLQGASLVLLISDAAPPRIEIRGKPNRRFADLQVGQQLRAGFYDPATGWALKLVIN